MEKKNIPRVESRFFTAVPPTSIDILINIPKFSSSVNLDLLRIAVIKLQYLFINLSYILCKLSWL